MEPLLSLCAAAVLPLLRSEEHQKAAACGGFPLSLNFHCWQRGEGFLVLLPTECSLSSLVARPWQQKSCTCRACQGPLGSWELLLYVPQVNSCILVYVCPSGFLLCPDHGALLVPRSSPCVLCCTDVWSVMGGSADPQQGQFEWFFGPSEDESENSPG